MTSVQAQAAMIASSSASSISASRPPVRIRSASSAISRTGLILRRSHSVAHLFSICPHASLPATSSISRKRLSPVMEWQDCTVKMEVDVPTSVAYKCYSDREAMPQWLPFISSVKIMEDKQDISKMCVKYKAFGQDLQFSLLARNLQPIPNQKIHWRSLDGVPNRGAVRFYPKGPSSCLIEALKPFMQGLLLRGLESFSTFAKDYQPSSPPSSSN